MNRHCSAAPGFMRVVCLKSRIGISQSNLGATTLRRMSATRAATCTTAASSVFLSRNSPVECAGGSSRQLSRWAYAPESCTRCNTFANADRPHSRRSLSCSASTRTNLVAILNRLEDAGLIERRRDRTDRRRAIIALSAHGAQLLAELDRALREIDDTAFATLTRAERETLNPSTRPSRRAHRDQLHAADRRNLLAPLRRRRDRTSDRRSERSCARGGATAGRG